MNKQLFFTTKIDEEPKKSQPKSFVLGWDII